jgi:hypothetical protein
MQLRMSSPKKAVPKPGADLALAFFQTSLRRSVSFAWSRMDNVASDLQASYVQQPGRLDYTAVVKRSDGQGVWSCEHITHHDASSAIECASRELARRTGPESGRQTRQS